MDDTYQVLVAQRGALFQVSGPEPELADSEVITISLIKAMKKSAMLLSANT